LERKVDYVDPNGTLKQNIDKEDQRREKRQSKSVDSSLLKTKFYENLKKENAADRNKILKQNRTDVYGMKNIAENIAVYFEMYWRENK